MSNTPSKKKQPVKPVEPKPKYRVSNKIFFIGYHKGLPEDIFEGEICSRISREFELHAHGDLSRRSATGISFSYNVRTKISAATLMEEEIYPSFQAAANKFAEPFTHLLK